MKGGLGLKGKAWMRLCLIGLSVLSVVFLGACAARRASDTQAPAAEWSGGAPASDGFVSESPAVASVDESAASSVDAGDTPLPRMIIYNGTLELVVSDTLRTQERVTALAEEMGGFVFSANSYAYGDNQRRAEIVVRVPAEQFNETMTALRGLGLDVVRDSVSSEEVTQEYVDLESRQRALEVKAAQLEKLMDRAEDTEAVLAVYHELSLTQQEIEQVKGRMNYLARSAALATITVTLTPDILGQPVEVAGWRPLGTARRAIEALVRTFQFLFDALIWVLLWIVPVFGVLGIALYGVVRLLMFVFRRIWPKTSKPAANDEDGMTRPQNAPRGGVRG